MCIDSLNYLILTIHESKGGVQNVRIISGGYAVFGNLNTTSFSMVVERRPKTRFEKILVEPRNKPRAFISAESKGLFDHR